MNKRSNHFGKKRLLLFYTLCGVAPLFACACGDGVETTRPQRGAIRESFVEPARTRLTHTYPISMPVTGRLERIQLEPGDRVKKGQRLVEMDLVPLDQAVAGAKAAIAALEAQISVKDDNRLENSALEELNATVDAVNEALKASATRIEAEQARLEHATKDLERTTELVKKSSAPQKNLDDAQLYADTSLIGLREQQFTYAAAKALQVAVSVGPRAVKEYIARKTLEKKPIEHQIAEARATLAQAEHDLKLAVIQSPIDGVVLERHEQGESLYAAGVPLLLLGDLDDMEVVAEILTQDALKLDKGAEVALEPATDMKPIAGRVKLIEPSGFTKLSSLGVEQQRVRAIVSLETRPERLGVGYQLQARFFTGAKQDALIVPRYSVLQSPDREFYVLKLDKSDILLKQIVRLGLESDMDLEIVEGLEENDRIVAKPATHMKVGAKVKPTEARVE